MSVKTGEHGPEKGEPSARKKEAPEVTAQLKILNDVVQELLKEHAAISHAVFDFRRALSRNAEAFYHAINKLRRKAPEWQIMDEDLLKLIENYQATASSLFFGGEDTKQLVVTSSS